MTRRWTAPAGASPWQRPPAARPLVLGHRGARQRAPENTLAAFQLALDEGADGVELDVRLDRSGEVIVLHDRTFARVSPAGDPRDAEALTTAEIAAIDVGGGERVPHLAEVLAWAAQHRARLNVEVKQDVSNPRRLVARVASLLRGAAGAAELVVLSSFHPGLLLCLARALPAVPTALLSAGARSPLTRDPTWHALGARGLHPSAALATPALITAVHARRGFVNVWTVNGASAARELAMQGVDGLITDDPRGIRAALG